MLVSVLQISLVSLLISTICLSFDLFAVRNTSLSEQLNAAVNGKSSDKLVWFSSLKLIVSAGFLWNANQHWQYHYQQQLRPVFL